MPSSTSRRPSPSRLRASQRPESLPTLPPFTTRPAPQAARMSGAGSGGGVDPDNFASSLLVKGHEWSGPALACYMLRRFGWPNCGSDDYKELFTWTLTTPMPGLYLYVSPRMCNDGSGKVTKQTLRSIYAGSAVGHFGYRHSEKVQQQLRANPPILRENHLAKRAVIRRWWKNEGHQNFTFVACGPQDKETQVMEWGPDSKHADHTWGLYRRSKTIERDIPAKHLAQSLHPRVVSHLAFCLDFAKENDTTPDKLTLKTLGITDWPKLDRDLYCRQRDEMESTGFIAQCNAALFATIKDLLTPTSVRDVYFNGLGRVHDDELEEADGSAPAWPGAGIRPQAWFTHPRLRRKVLAGK